jgi:phage tail-like protein
VALDKNAVKAAYPLPVYNYRVSVLEMGGDGDVPTIGFSEVSGLNVQYDAVIYRHGLSYATGFNIIPGMRQPVKLTLKRGIVPNNDYLKSWLEATNHALLHSGLRRNVVIDLCDEQGKPVVRWTVIGAMPTKLDAPSFDASSNDVAIESLELTAHDLKIDFDP